MLLVLLLLAALAAANAAAAYSPKFDCEGQLEVTVLVQPGSVRLQLRLFEATSEFVSDKAATQLHTEPLQHLHSCFYQGEVAQSRDGDLVFVKRLDGMISGTFSWQGENFEIPEQKYSLTEFDAVKLPPSPPRRCGVDKNGADAASTSRSGAASGQRNADGSRLLSRGRRAVLKADTHSAVPLAQRKFIRLALYGDTYYSRLHGGFLAAFNRLYEIGNYVNGYYRQLGITVVLTDVQVWFTEQITLNSENNTAGVNTTELLQKFLTYRMQSVTAKNSAAHLVTGRMFQGGEIGLAMKGELCQFASGGGVNRDHQPNSTAMATAATVAHELGHNLGMNHDEDEPGCFCPSGTSKCVMAGVGDASFIPQLWANCSISRSNEFMVPAGLQYCMSEPIEASIAKTDLQSCGNGIVDRGEQCDCGLPSQCKSSCCNASSCQLLPGASCASGGCCNTSSCQLQPQGILCRSERSSCDLPEYCNGTSEWCPEFDDLKADGTVCTVSSTQLSRCYKGTCAHRDSRCAELYLGNNIRSNENFINLTMQGTANGYCSYSASTFTSPVSYTYTGCSYNNRRCGNLYCSGSFTDDYPFPKWKGAPATTARSFIPAGESRELAVFQLDLRPSGPRDPGLVPNGAECGADAMCINSVCTPLSTASAASACGNCSGHGVCTLSGQCFCNYGFAPPNCSSPGVGGSLTNSLPFTMNLTTAMPTTTTKSTTTMELTTLDQSVDNFWPYIAIAAGVILLILLAFAGSVWLCIWCRRNDTRPYTGGLRADDTQPAATVSSGIGPGSYYASSDLTKSYPIMPLDSVLLQQGSEIMGKDGSYVKADYS